jgi:chemotaxis protein methyltransferase CheR
MSEFSNALPNVSGQFNVLQAGSGNQLAMSDQIFNVLRHFIYDSCGIYFQDNKKYLLESRILKRINFLGLNSYEEYFDFIKLSTNNGTEKKYLFEAITINETFFFRNQPQLDALVSSVIPEILSKKTGPDKNKLKIWSAASSSGEEAYSVAMIILDLVKPRFPSLEVEIVGTDINHAVIETAKSGKYKEYSVRNTPAYYLKKYFKSNGNSFELEPHVKNMVSFKMLNLYEDINLKAMFNFDIVFCANVLIYFDQRSKVKVVSHLYNSLNKGGYLFIGYAETLHTISKAFKLVSFPKTIGYKKE